MSQRRHRRPGRGQAENMKPTRAQVSRSERDRQRLSDQLDNLVDHVALLLDQTDAPRPLAVAGVALYLHDEVGHLACAGMLAVAIERMADQGEAHPRLALVPPARGDDPKTVNAPACDAVASASGDPRGGDVLNLRRLR